MAISFFAVSRGALHGKTIGRILLNHAIAERCTELHGKVLDLAGGDEPGYLKYLPQGIDLVRSSRTAAPGVSAIDFNKQLPFPDQSFDAILLFNALYIAENQTTLLTEMHRILKRDGVCFIISPFIANEMREPHDYIRFTSEGLNRLLTQTSFTNITLFSIGERASAATQLLQPLFLFNIVRAIIFPFVLWIDMLIPERIKKEHPTPISYFVRCEKIQ